MNKRVAENPDDFFKTGNVLAISPLGKSNVELSASISELSLEEILLELARPTVPPLFQIGERVRIKYWDENGLYCSEPEVLEVSGSDYQYVRLSRSCEGTTMQRRKSSRIHASIALSFTVIDADKTRIVGEAVDDARTQDISLGGLRFETSLPLKVGDRLIVQLDLLSQQKVSLFGWVVRAKTIERNGKYINSIGVEFLQLGGKEQDQLLPVLAQLSNE